MAQNVFDASLERNNQLDRNPFDWSHVWNGTTKHGTITPVFCELVPQKHSIRINPEFGLEMMPMIFPVQTRQFARLNFFKVTLRSLWEDYMDYVSNYRDDLEEPYLLPDEQAFKKAFLTGTLGDYLNIPTRGVAVSSSSTHDISPYTIPGIDCLDKSMFVSGSSAKEVFSVGIRDNDFSSLKSSCIAAVSASSSISIIPTVSSVDNSLILALSATRSIDVETQSLSLLFRLEFKGDLSYFDFSKKPSIAVCWSGSAFSSAIVLSQVKVAFKGIPRDLVYEVSVDLTPGELDSLRALKKSPNEPFVLLVGVDFHSKDGSTSHSFNYDPSDLNLVVSSLSVSDEETAYSTTPFATQSNPDNLRLLAYKFRAYEAVYNAFYRDVRNDPFIVDGRPVYNKWLPTMKGGADSTPYELHQCNWERDMFTTCIPSPQQGRAPLAGLTVYDAVTANEDGSYSVKKATALVTEDGAKYGITYNVSEDGQTLETVDYEPLSDKTEVVPIRSTLDLVNSGLSIETLRMTNAYQKYLELNMRKSFTYKAIMEGRYDVNLRFDELLMPEFIGGVSREMSMNVSEQSVDQQSTPDNGLYKDALGSKAGIAGVYGKANGNIECFCDEESIVIGLLTVTPVPIYTQMLPKDYTYRSVLDHWSPEFSAIGYQPVTYKEMCPLNVAAQSDISKLEDTFGYQRPWYEHVAKYDTAHGLFRSNMNGFLMTRFFSGFPELCGAFLKVDPNVVNQVFSVTEFTDKIFGYVKFDCVVQSPIPRVAIPRID